MGLRWYGLSYLLGFLFGYLALRRAIKDGRIQRMDVKDLETLLFAIMIGVVAGGRLGFVLQHPDRLLSDPLFFFKFNEGGMAFFGGLSGVVLALLWFGRRKKIRFGELGDAVTIAAALGLACGRLANFMNAELWGVPTNSNWGVVYSNVDQVPRHPSELYESASHFLLAVALWLIGRLGWSKNSGELSCYFVIVYGALRFVTEQYRTADRFVGPFTNGQVASLIIALIGVLALVLVRRAAQKRDSLKEF